MGFKEFGGRFPYIAVRGTSSVKPGLVKRRKMNFDTVGTAGTAISPRYAIKGIEMTEVNWLKLKQACRICVGSAWCDEHTKEYEKVERYRKRRGIV